MLCAGPAAAAGTTGQGWLKVVENNDFKQLPHITLALHPGSDAAVKQWLAFRLGEVRGDAAQLSAQLQHTQVRGWVCSWANSLPAGGWLAVHKRVCKCRGRGWMCQLCRHLPPSQATAPFHHATAHCLKPCLLPCALQAERNSLQLTLEEVRAAAALAKERHERLILEWGADAKAREAALLEAKSKELADLREEAARWAFFGKS